MPAPGAPQGPSLLKRVDGLQRLGELRQLIEPVAPALWLVPGMEDRP
ncbi:hypothetical protein QWM81_04450 [Streptomyces ficellus]|uniref:Uncharacterized protein n=1 Tax=Streptomyces ficellus TaxID=1977088 RepID=A0ABT7Z1G7_9ACTN|nr:hypothetical protein [Streptomyces ficellus]MDN3293311.1 hypothetical protein [Streptomyces ficellus]